MEEILCKILSDFKVLAYKIHLMHVNMHTDLLLSYHPFLWEVYLYLEDQIDDIMEDMSQLEYELPYSLKDLIAESDIMELRKCITDPKEMMPIVSKDLIVLITNLQEGIEIAGGEEDEVEETDEEDESKIFPDMVIQNNLIEYQKTLRKFERKNRRMMDFGK